ncbi:sigma-70 family RNA polymerase sigma factor [Glaciihabitans sp. dw_435]|uniref:sigma-70 family RNA polymerase sigma factor n=1 Tax=Glaciihabitans sp. dw_435 TaxID=2720081 RepID=UPI001BD530B5|nr:sigma-70 family RNA polymerase sigma factor [Glaciihabitans sp. dw_435]
MTDPDTLAHRFDAQRPRLVAIARRLVGSFAEAEDVVQDAWMRLQRVHPDEVDNLDAWLTTVVSRLSLDVVRSPRYVRERRWDVTVWDRQDDPSRGDPLTDVAQADRVGTALLVVLELLTPAERLALVLHDVFGMSFDEVATLIDRTPENARQLASRARRRVRQSAPTELRDRGRERSVVTAWLEAVQTGDFSAILELLDDGAVLTADYGVRRQVLVGSREIADNAVLAGRLAAHSTLARIDGRPGIVATVHGKIVSLMVFAIAGGRITGLNVLADPDRIATLAIPPLLRD